MNPKIHPSCFVAESAVIIGNVVIEKGCAIFPNAVIRGDLNSIVIGEGSNVQEHCAIHCTKEFPTTIGKNVSVGHGAVVHGVKVGDDCIIGVHSTILDGAEIGAGTLIGANALVTSGMKIPPKSLVIGVPAKVVKESDELLNVIRRNADVYHRLREEHLAGKHGIFRKQE